MSSGFHSQVLFALWAVSFLFLLVVDFFLDLSIGCYLKLTDLN